MLLKDSAQRALLPSDDPEFTTDSLQYGDDNGPKKFRKTLAAFLSKQWPGVEVTPEQLLVTNGASNGTSMLLRELCKTEKSVWCSDPTYFLALDIMKDLQLDVTGIECDEQGYAVIKFIYTFALSKMCPN